MSSNKKKSQIRVINFNPSRPNIAVAAGGEEIKLIEFAADFDPSDDPSVPTVLRHTIGTSSLPKKFIISAAVFNPFNETELAIGTLAGHVVVFDVNKDMKLDSAKYAHIRPKKNNDQCKIYPMADTEDASETDMVKYEGEYMEIKEQ